MDEQQPDEILEGETMTTTESQERQLQQYMEAGNTVTGLEAMNLFGCMRLPARVADMKKNGVPVQDDWEYELDENGKVVKKWKKYWIA
jgi:hypothetical protein